MFALVLVLLFIVVPVVELWLILQIGDAIGVWPTIFLLIFDSLVGAWLVKSQGGQVWRRFRETSGAGRVPANEAVDGFLVILGGTLLLVPGFLTDLVGIFLVIPPTRQLLRNRSIRFVTKRARVTFMGGSSADDTRVRDFAHSDQPRSRASSTAGERDPEFDFQTHQIHE